MHAPAPGFTVRDRAAAGVALVCLSFVGLAAGAGGLGATAIAALTGLGAALIGAAWRQFARAVTAPAGLAFAAFVLWALTTALWSPYDDPSRAWMFALGVPAYAGFAVWCVLAADRRRRRLQGAFVAAMISGAVLIAFEAATGGAITKANRPPDEIQYLIWRNLGHGVSLLSLLTPAFVCLAWPRGLAMRAVAVGVCLVAVMGAVVFGITANVAGLMGGALFGVLAYWAPRFGLWAVGVCVAAAVALAPLVAFVVGFTPEAVRAAMPLSWEYRIEVWSFLADKIAASPFIGYGFDASRTIHDTVDLRGFIVDVVPLHPHNAGVHIWLETGVVGAALLVAAIALTTRSVVRRLSEDRLGAAAAAGGAGAYLFISLVSYGVWQEWWIAAGFITAGAAMLAVGPTPSQAPDASRP